MNTQERDSIFSILYAVVLIDKRVIKVEMDLFFAIIESFLRAIERVETLEAKANLSNWFIKNYKNILREMKSPNKRNFMMEHVENLKLYPHRNMVFEMMKEIALSDDEYHEEERIFLETVTTIWNLD